MKTRGIPRDWNDEPARLPTARSPDLVPANGADLV